MIKGYLRTLHASYLNTPDGGAGGGGAPVQPGGGTTPPPAGPWYQTAGVDQSHHEWLNGKQFSNVNAALESYRSLEGVLGRNRLAVPSGPEDTAGYDAIYKTLGRPDTHEGYTLKEGGRINADEFKQHYAAGLHKLGMSQAQVAGAIDLMEQRDAAVQQEKEAKLAGEEAQQKQALSAKWGANEQANTDIASRAFRALGLSAEETDGIESVLGYQKTMELFHRIGAGMGEGSFHQDGKPGETGGVNTLEAAKAAIDAKTNDPEFKARYRHDNPTVRAKAIAELEPLQMRYAELQQAAETAAWNAPFDPKNPTAGRRR